MGNDNQRHCQTCNTLVPKASCMDCGPQNKWKNWSNKDKRPYTLGDAIADDINIGSR